MASKKMNVLVYSGTGTTTESVRHCLYTLRRLLSPTYAIIPITGDILLKEPWSPTCALLVMPGGADLGYCRTLNGDGNRRITQYVNRGGSYLGFCAGGYYGSARCEFEVDDEKMAVVGERELGFYPGFCRGAAFGGFVYGSEAGARAADVRIEKGVFGDVKDDVKDTFKSYYNGGGVFVDAKKLESRGVQILARYTEDLHVDSGDSAAAVVYRKIGEGHVVLTGPHPEFAPNNLTRTPKLPSFSEAIDQISSTDSTRIAFMRLLLQKLGLKVNEEEQVIPPLSNLHLSAHSAAEVSDLLLKWSEVITLVDGEEYIKAQNDVFHVGKYGAAWGVSRLKNAVEAVSDVLPTAITGKKPAEDDTKAEDDTIKKVLDCITYTSSTTSDNIIDYNKIIKYILPHEISLPTLRETPLFHHEAYYANLSFYHSKLGTPSPTFGTPLLYGEVVTSTNTLLEKNPALLNHLPTGFTLTATTQIAGRGRGANVWVAPPGGLMFSTVIHHPLSLNQTAPVIFVQYLASIAIIRGIKKYGPGYDRLPVRLKWPNDIYAAVPPHNPSTTTPTPLKIGGILINSTYTSSLYTLICGIGLNLSNPHPTTSLSFLCSQFSPPLPPPTSEKLLASILAQFNNIYLHFCKDGWDRTLEEEYYEYWLHTGQMVTLEGGLDGKGGREVKARIRGIEREWGQLVVEEVGTGRVLKVQSDGNSFDFFRGLVGRKV